MECPVYHFRCDVTRLNRAAYYNDTDEINALINSGVNVNIPTIISVNDTIDLNPALHIAADHGSIDAAIDEPHSKFSYHLP